MKKFSKLFFCSILVLAAACAKTLVEVPPHEGLRLDEVIAERNAIERIDAAMSIVFEKKDSEMYGDAVLDITRSGDLNLKVFTLGILGMDLSSKNGVVKSTPRLDKAKTAILTRGLRDSLFWWDLQDFTVREEGGYLVMQSATRSVWLDRKTLLPGKQLIEFDDGKQLTIIYDTPAHQGGIWYQTKMRIEIPRYAVTLTVKEISFLKNM
ncbi:MAG TPA: hypothetical protein VEP69_02275 [Thermodesulfovibrionales bacterium]|nr:hypothetical protein [Thermodesulfovibrionales bacterium]